jgi:hypothetical protein
VTVHPDQPEPGVVLAAVKHASRRLRRWPAAMLDRSCARHRRTIRSGQRNGPTSRTEKHSKGGSIPTVAKGSVPVVAGQNLMNGDGGGSVILRTVRGSFGPAGLFTSSAISFRGIVGRLRGDRQSVAHVADYEGDLAHVLNKGGRSRSLAAAKLCRWIWGAAFAQPHPSPTSSCPWRRLS